MAIIRSDRVANLAQIGSKGNAKRTTNGIEIRTSPRRMYNNRLCFI